MAVIDNVFAFRDQTGLSEVASTDIAPPMAYRLRVDSSFGRPFSQSVQALAWEVTPAKSVAVEIDTTAKNCFIRGGIARFASEDQGPKEKTPGSVGLRGFH
jgi:hypothetical protein